MHFANKSGSFGRRGSSQSKRSTLWLREERLCLCLLAACGINSGHSGGSLGFQQRLFVARGVSLTWTSASRRERANSGWGRWLVRAPRHFFSSLNHVSALSPSFALLMLFFSFFSRFPFFNWKLGVGLSPTQSPSSCPGAMDAPLFSTLWHQRVSSYFCQPLISFPGFLSRLLPDLSRTACLPLDSWQALQNFPWPFHGHEIKVVFLPITV